MKRLGVALASIALLSLGTCAEAGWHGRVPTSRFKAPTVRTKVFTPKARTFTPRRTDIHTEFHPDKSIRRSEFHRDEPGRRSEFHPDKPDRRAEFHRDEPGRRSEFRPDKPDRRAEFHRDESGRRSEFHPDKPDRRAELHADKPDKRSEFHRDKPDRRAEFHADKPDRRAEFHADKPDRRSELHPDKPDRRAELRPDKPIRRTESHPEFRKDERGTSQSPLIGAKTRIHVDPADSALVRATDRIAKAPKLASARIDRAALLARRDRFHDAMADLDTAIAIDSYDRNAYLNRAILWERFGDSQKALADYEAAEKKGGLEPWLALQARAAVRVRMKDYRQAAADLEAASVAAETTHKPDVIAPILVKRAELAREQRSDLPAALALAQRAVELLPTSAEAIVELGRAYEAMGQRAEALAGYQKALDMTPGSDTEHGASVHAWALFRLKLLQQGSDASDAASQPGRAHFVTFTSDTLAPEKKANEKRVALVIGNSHYANVASLPNAERDVAYVAMALLSAGFESVRLGLDLDKAALDQALKDFDAHAAEASWAFVYYAGHGVELGDKNYLVPVDADQTALREADSRAVPLDEVIDHVKLARTLRVVMLDACRDNPFVQEAHRAQSESRSIMLPADELSAFHDIGGGLTPVKAEDVGTFLAFAAEHGEAALDGNGLDSPFAEAFVRNVSAPGVEIRSLFEKVRGDVLAATQQQQHPTVFYKLPDDKNFIFVER